MNKQRGQDITGGNYEIRGSFTARLARHHENGLCDVVRLLVEEEAGAEKYYYSKDTTKRQCFHSKLFSKKTQTDDCDAPLSPRAHVMLLPL